MHSNLKKFIDTELNTKAIFVRLKRWFGGKNALGKNEERKIAGILEGSATNIQFVCPYCEAVQTETTGLDVFFGEEDKRTCEKCGKIMKVKHWRL
jgi:hypothetical protein